jgi:uncharacterized protein
MDQHIYKRLVIDEILTFLSTDDIIVLHGSRQVGKTSIMLFLKNYLEKSGQITHFIDLEDLRYLSLLDSGIHEFIKYLDSEGLLFNDKKTYVFIDEIQYLNNPSSFLKLAADHHKNIKIIVSGSSSFNIKKKFKDSLVGRTINFEIFPLSFEEYLVFKNYKYSGHRSISPIKNRELSDLYTEYVLYGGYPKIAQNNEIKMKEKYLQQIIDTYIRKDINSLADIGDIMKFNKLIEILASQSGQLLNITELANTSRLNKLTVEKYISLLEETYIIRLVRPYSANLRAELFKTPKVFFIDTGLMQMLWLKKIQNEIIGNVFETSIFSELIKKYGKNNIFYWRTKEKKEIDFIRNDHSGILPIEVKLNFQQISLNYIKYFLEKYKLTEYRCIGLYGTPDKDNYEYPWGLK